ncbi:MAG: lipocalin-like domain-containing protein [Gammaproteobacteria bacterium]|nr:lipocalin-like domain-containing protein [Gammaproteobacteria bacterium]
MRILFGKKYRWCTALPAIAMGLMLILPIGNPALGAEGARHLVGTWQLVSWINKQADGSTDYPMGESPVGLLICDAHGNLSLQVMDDFRPTFESGYEQTSLEELKEVYKTYSAMFGAYTVDTTNRTIEIQVRGITNPNYLGSTLTRYYDFGDSTLTLSLNKERTNSTVWKKIK